ncbi:hypothetical protein [Lusitaniella coriacea]|uniref:hypothetical protein n=1 Tax=Lusitaniella coriacea TaxID=1983105 RepID=UPI003CF51A83
MIQTDFLTHELKQTENNQWEEIESLKSKLELIYKNAKHKKKEIKEKSRKIAEILEKAWLNQDLLERSKFLRKAREKTEELNSKYSEFLEEVDRKAIDFLAKDIESQFFFYQSISLIELAEKSTNLEILKSTFLAGVEFLSQAVDKYWNRLDSQQRIIAEQINKKIWALSSQEENKIDRVDLGIITIHKAAREVTGFTLWRIQELKEKQSLQEKEFRRREALENLRKRVKLENQPTEEGEESLRSLQKTIDSFRPNGYKVYRGD